MKVFNMYHGPHVVACFRSNGNKTAPDNIANELNISIERSNVFEGVLTQYTSWTASGIPEDEIFIGEVAIYLDGKSHWNFYGENYPEAKDVYYCLGDLSAYLRHMSYLWFAYECANLYYKDNEHYNHSLMKDDRLKYEQFWCENDIFKDYKVIKID